MTDELMALLAKATAGEWIVARDRCHFDSASDICVDGRCIAQTISDYPAIEHDAAAIVAAVNFCRNELPALISERDALREALQALCNSHRAALYPAEFAAARAALGASHDAG